MTRIGAPSLFNTARTVTLLCSIIVALGSGTHYIYSAYSPQLGARLHISHTQLNVIGFVQTVGTSTSGPVWGRIVDLKGPRILLIGAFTCLFLGYAGIRHIYDNGIGDNTSIPTFHFLVLVLCAFVVGWGCNAGILAAVNTTAKSFPNTAHGTTIGIVFSALGLSAFWFSTLANILFPGDTSAFLLTLAVGTAAPMVVGFFILRPVPYLPARKPDVPSVDTEADTSTPLLQNEDEISSRRVSESSSLIEMNHPRSPSRGRGDRTPNIHGKQLWLHRDFYLLFAIVGLLCGTGIMYINNVGTIARALYAKANPIINELEASKWQAAQVSTVSIGNFSGRILSGFLSDLMRNKLHLPRAYCLCIVSSLFIVSQAFAMGVSVVSQLWMASALLGIAYGSMYGLTPAIMIDWFGLAHLSENWGYINFATLIGGNLFSRQEVGQDGADAWGSAVAEAERSMGSVSVGDGEGQVNGVSAEDRQDGVPIKKFRGIPENVRLFEVFWKQVVELIKARPDLSIQDITALLVSLTNLSLSCYPDRLEYVDQILGFAHDKIKEFAESPDIHAPQTASNLAALLVAPINSYQSVLTLLAIPRYVPLLSQQLFLTRRSIAHSVISSVLKNETIIETPNDVNGVLDLCHVLITDQSDAAPASGNVKDVRRHGPVHAEREDLAEEQGWVARMVHLFKANSLDVQFELLQTARKHFEAGGERMRYTFPALITSSIKLCRRYKNREHLEEDWQTKVTTILKFVRECTSILATQVEAPALALRLYLLAAQIASECGSGFEDLAYDFYVQAFSVYEDSISESRAQLAAITLIIGTLQGARVFEVDGYDTLITKAALHGAKLLKKPHQAMAVHAASHLWWQEPVLEDGDGEGDGEARKEAEKASSKEKEKEDGEGAKAYPHQDSKRVLECLQKSLRIARSATEEIVTVQLYCETLDQYLYYFDRGAPAIAPKFIVSLVELITSSIDSISSPSSSSSYVHPSQRIEGVASPEMITRHFRNTLSYIYSKKTSENPGRYDEVDIVGALLKMGITR